MLIWCIQPKRSVRLDSQLTLWTWCGGLINLYSYNFKMWSDVIKYKPQKFSFNDPMSVMGFFLVQQDSNLETPFWKTFSFLYLFRCDVGSKIIYQTTLVSRGNTRRWLSTGPNSTRARLETKINSYSSGNLTFLRQGPSVYFFVRWRPDVGRYIRKEMLPEKKVLQNFLPIPLKWTKK